MNHNKMKKYRIDHLPEPPMYKEFIIEDKIKPLLDLIESKSGKFSRVFSIIMFILIFAFLFYGILPGQEDKFYKVCAANENFLCQETTCTYDNTDCDTSTGNDAYCDSCASQGGSWSIGGEVSATTCCGDDSADFISTDDEYSAGSISWEGNTAECCNANDCVTDSDNCQASTTSSANYGSLTYLVSTGATGDDEYAYCYGAGGQDGGAGWLDCDVGSWFNNWCGNAGICGVASGGVYAGEAGVGEYSDTITLGCCGDDGTEEFITETQGTDTPATFDDSTYACCTATNDCVSGTTCYSTTTVSGSGVNDGYCNAGSWDGGDAGQTQCEALSDTWISTGTGANSDCCGDDSLEDFESTNSNGNKVCYNAAVLNDGSISSSILNQDGLMYDCGGTTSDDSSLSTHVGGGSCTTYEGYYCQIDNSWAIIIPVGCACTSNAQCLSELCASGVCSESGVFTDYISLEISATDEITISNIPPTTPLLVSPTEGNITVRNRTESFTWLASTDIDGGDINYTINITHATCPDIYVTNITDLFYVPTSDLCLDTKYFWQVRAHDGSGYGDWSEYWNFTVESVVSIKLINDTVSFGTMQINETKNTTLDGFSSLVLENDGNVVANISRISANQSIFDNVDLNTIYFRFKADNTTNEQGSFNYTGSVTNWTNITLVSDLNKTVISQLNYNNTNDTAEIDILLTIPPQEPPGTKTVTIYITGEGS